MCEMWTFFGLVKSRFASIEFPKRESKEIVTLFGNSTGQPCEH